MTTQRCTHCSELEKMLSEARRELAIVQRQLDQYRGSQIASYHQRRRDALQQYRRGYEVLHSCKIHEPESKDLCESIEIGPDEDAVG